jgi:hypothetical protein
MRPTGKEAVFFPSAKMPIKFWFSKDNGKSVPQ